MRVWIAQCLCPQRHTILAAAGEVDGDKEAATRVHAPLRATVADMIQLGIINDHCGLCHAKADTWTYEVAPTEFATLEEAQPHLKQLETEQAAVRAVWGDMKRSD